MSTITNNPDVLDLRAFPDAMLIDFVRELRESGSAPVLYITSKQFMVLDEQGLAR